MKDGRLVQQGRSIRFAHVHCRADTQMTQGRAIRLPRKDSATVALLPHNNNNYRGAVETLRTAARGCLIRTGLKVPPTGLVPLPPDPHRDLDSHGCFSALVGPREDNNAGWPH